MSKVKQNKPKIINRRNKKKELRKQIGFTLLIALVFRTLSLIPVPFVDTSSLGSAGAFGLADALSGGSLSGMTLMAFGVSTYITASIIIQLLTSQFKKMYRIVASPGGQERSERWNLYLMIFLTVIGSFTMIVSKQSSDSILLVTGWWVHLIIVAVHVLGSIIAFYLGKLIDKKGVGNGLSLLIFINIVSSLPAMINSLLLTGTLFANGWVRVAIWGVVVLTMIMASVLMDNSFREAKIQHGASLARGNAGFRENRFDELKFKLNLNGVMPIILSYSLIEGLNSLSEMFPNNEILSLVSGTLEGNSIVFLLVMTVLILSFSFFYTSITQNPYRTSEQLQANKTLVLGVQPGRKTTELLKKEFKLLSWTSGLFMIVMFVLPTIVSSLIGLQLLQATSILIMVGVGTELISSYLDKKKLIRQL